MKKVLAIQTKQKRYENIIFKISQREQASIERFPEFSIRGDLFKNKFEFLKFKTNDNKRSRLSGL